MRRNYDMMPDDELRELAKLRNKRGEPTAEAYRAQEVLWDRCHWDEVDMRDDCEQYLAEERENK